MLGLRKFARGAFSWVGIRDPDRRLLAALAFGGMAPCGSWARGRPLLKPSHVGAEPFERVAQAGRLAGGSQWKRNNESAASMTIMSAIR
jgi:hypothetical protein